MLKEEGYISRTQMQRAAPPKRRPMHAPAEPDADENAGKEGECNEENAKDARGKCQRYHALVPT
jgi:hypothetical protein